MITIYKIIEPLEISNLNTFRDNAPFFQQQKKNRILRIFFVNSTGEKMEEVLLSGFGTHSNKSLNKAAGRITVYDEKARRKNEYFSPLTYTNLLRVNNRIDFNCFVKNSVLYETSLQS